jgi:hypothetical protein
MSRNERSDGYSDQNTKLHKDSPFFVDLCEEMGAQCQSLLFCCNSLWLSREKVMASVYNLREVLAMFLDEENLVHAEHFRNENFASKLQYLSDIFRSLIH